MGLIPPDDGLIGQRATTALRRPASVDFSRLFIGRYSLKILISIISGS
jgi:hypothetical protein